MKENISEIKGDNNIVIQDTKKSNISINDTEPTKTKRNKYQILGILIAVITLIATIIIGWDKIKSFFNF